jgi:threonine synthase
MEKVTLGEGNTPLIESVYVGPSLGLSRLFFKLENCNPSGSYKDRFVATEIARCLKRGARACFATSSGNTGASLAAYCARYGLRCFVVVNDFTPPGKLLQIQAHHARIIRVEEFARSPEVTDRVFQCLHRLSKANNIPLIVSAFHFCPVGMVGVEGISHELIAQLSSGIDHVFVPVGGGGLFSAVCQGFQSQDTLRPRVHAVQPRSCSTVVAAYERGDDEIRLAGCTTRISGLAVPIDLDASLALRLLRQCNGLGLGVDDEEVFEAQGQMLAKEGIFCEPAGAAAIAGLKHAIHKRAVSKDDTVVCLVTGHGFKDPESLQRAAIDYPPVAIQEPELEKTLLAYL